MRTKTYPRNWLSRRWHSLLGLWLVVFILEHLLTNSQAALFFGHDGKGYIEQVNWIHGLPFLPIIEIGLIGLPFLLHALWGIHYAVSGRFNSVSSDGRRPALTRYPRNHAYSWQRIASWVILVGVILHVIQMRFLEYPATVMVGGEERLYIVDLGMDEGLYTVAARLGVELYDQKRIDQIVAEFEILQSELSVDERRLIPSFDDLKVAAEIYDAQVAQELDFWQLVRVDERFVEGLLKKYPKSYQVAAVTDQFGKASLLVVRGVMRNPWMILLYSIFVLAAVYHGFRGLWSFMIVWGFTLTPRSQRYMATFSTCIMVVWGLLGLSAAWLTYWVNLRT